MIKFFRKIRISLILNNRIGGYILYAIGEIILVVIGILIALEINDWNDLRKQKQLEQSYYCKIYEDVIQDHLQIEKHLEENENRIKSSNELLHLLQEEHPDRADVIEKLQAATSKTTFTFKPSMAAFEDLKSSGNLRVIKDIDLKDKLIKYYSTLEGYIDIIDVNSDKTVALYFDTNRNFSELGMQNINFVKAELDTNMVDINRLNAVNYPSSELRKQLTSDGVFYLATNARKKMIYKVMEKEINEMQALISLKCQKIETN